MPAGLVQQPGQRGRYLGSCRTPLRHLLHALLHQSVQDIGNIQHRLQWRSLLKTADPDAKLLCGGLRIRPAPGQQLVHHQPPGPDVGGSSALLAEPLLGRHVGRSPGDSTAGRLLRPADAGLLRHGFRNTEPIKVRPGWRGFRRSINGLGQAKIHHSQTPVLGDKHVFRLEVPVEDLAGMRLLQRFCNGQPDAQALGKTQRLLHALAQGLSLQVLQRYKGASLVLADAVDRNDVRVRKAGRNRGLVEKSLHSLL